MDYTEINAKTIDSWVKDGWEWGIPVTHEAYIKAGQGEMFSGITERRNFTGRHGQWTQFFV